MYRYPHVPTVVEVLAERKQVGHTGQKHGHRVDVEAKNVALDVLDDCWRVPPCSFGGDDDLPYRLEDKRA